MAGLSSSRPAPLRLRRLDTADANRPLLSADSASSPRASMATDNGKHDEAMRVNSPPSTASASPRPHSRDGATLYEKKCFLINAEIDNNGMGRYQWYIFFLCGFGYLLDLLWAQAFGLILSPLEQELGFGGNQSGNISVAFSSGLTAGAFCWGVLVDIIGRQWAFNLTCLISGAFGISLGGCNTYTAFLVITAFVGFGIGGNIPIDTTICLEFIPQDRRFMLALLSVFQPIGVILTSAIAYGFIPNYSCSPNFSEENPLPSCHNVAQGVACCTKDSNMGWRYLLFTLGAITFTVFFARFFLFNFKESPKFLVYRGKDAKAIQTLEHIAKTNNRPCGVILADFEAIDEEHRFLSAPPEAKLAGQDGWRGRLAQEMARYRQLFIDASMTRLTILIWLTYAFDFWGFTLAGTYLPTILAIKNASLNISLRHTYRSYLAIYTPGIIGVVLGSTMYAVPRIGRKLAMIISSGLMGASIFIFSTVNNEASNIGLNALEYFFQSMFNAVLYGWTPEAFPAPIRGTACGVAAFWGRLFSILAPLTAQSLIPKEGFKEGDQAINQVLYLAGGLTLGCVLTVSLLPNNKMGQQSL